MRPSLSSLAALLLVPSAAFANEPYKNELEGYEITAPPAWKQGLQDGRLLFGSDTEAGLMVAWFDPRLNEAAMKQAAGQGISDANMQLQPKGEPRPYSGKAGKGWQVDLTGAAADGSPLSARAIGILSPHGGAMGLLALTTPEKIAGLLPRLEALAKSIKFTKPNQGSTVALRGALCSYSGNANFSSSQKLVFDGQGGASHGSEFIASGKLSNGYEETGSWGANSGNMHQPTSAGRYQVSGDNVHVEINGNVWNCLVHYRQTDGRITELKCGGTLWGASLCE